MEMLVNLWAPILLSAALVWVASALMWMVMPHHKKDHIGLANEQALIDFIKAQGITPGNYGFPHFGTKGECRTPEAQKKWKEGPLGLLSVWPTINMPRNMILTFFVYLVVSTLIAYVGAATLDPGTPFAKVMQVLGTTGVLAYSFSFIPGAIWFCQYPRAIIATVIDGIIYGLITGAAFAWLWPHA